MPSRAHNRSIPVPRDQANASSRNDQQQQAPWRSSLDLVWSYSRSQAFYGNNIATSPSFIERRWAGQDLEGDESIYEDDEDELSDQEEYDAASVSQRSRSGTEADTDADSSSVHSDSRFGPGELEWEGENLPRNATSGRRRRRSKARDRRLEQLESADEDERSRSRSRSPKRLSGQRPNSNLVPSQIQQRHSQYSNTTSASSASAGAGAQQLRDPLAEDEQLNSKDSEVTPLLPSNAASGARRTSGYGALRHHSDSAVFSVRSDSGYKLHGLGTSTFLQSWFNTVNALVGVGILALPLAFSYAGWIGGVVLFLICGLLTNYTGKVLAKIMAKEPSLRTYADIGSYAFGPSARILISLFFCLELWAVSVALIILFGDSMSAIFPSIPPAGFKAIAYAIVLPTVFLPLKFLSPISVVGIFSTFTLVVVVLSDGLVKKKAPGSLWDPAPTAFGPQWNRVPLSFGLIMSGFSSHPIIPSLIRDMKDPSQFPRMLNLAYLAATVLYLSMGMIGYAMFGRSVSDEITRDLAKTQGFPVLLNRIAIWLIVINPLAKFALATRPIQTTFEILMGIDDQTANRVAAMKRRRSSSAKSVNKAPSLKQIAEPDTGEANGEGVIGGSKAMQQKLSSTTATTLSSSPSQRVSFASPQKPQRAMNGHIDAGAQAAGTSGFGDGEEGVSGDNPLAGSAISMRAAQATARLSPRTRHLCQIGLKILLTALITGTAIVLPGFEKVMAFLGAFLAFATCVFGPLLANLKLFGKEMKMWRISLDVVILAISAVMAATGTVWAFLPSHRVK